MSHRLFAALVAAALAAPSVQSAAAVPAPAPTPLRTITHIKSSPLCTGLRKAVAPAVAKVLQSDRIVASSKPLFHDFVQASASGQSEAAQGLAVMRLERLVGPLVANTETVDKLLNSPYVFPKVPRSADDRKLLQLRAQLLAINQQQKKALDVISGFVATEQLGQLQAAGHEYDSALSPNVRTSAPPNPAPTAADAPILNAGVSAGTNGPDPVRSMDPRYKNTDSMLANNPLNVFENAITSYQQQIQAREQDAAKSVIDAVPLCGGRVPGQAPPVPSAAPSPAPTASP